MHEEYTVKINSTLPIFQQRCESMLAFIKYRKQIPHWHHDALTASEDEVVDHLLATEQIKEVYKEGRCRFHSDPFLVPA